MNAGEDLIRALKVLGKELDAEHFEPDPERNDWADTAQAVSKLRRVAEDDVLRVVEPGLEALDASEPELQNLRNHAAQLVAEVGAVLHASGQRDAAARMIGAALDLRPTGPTLEELGAAVRDPEGFTLLVLGRWHQRSGDFASGDRVLARAKRTTKERALSAVIDRCLGGPRPLTSGAPAMFRINGCGLALYGERDRWDDGSHVSTYCVCLLFIPVFPISAYRVVEHGGGSYTFLARERLSGFARGYQWLVAAAVALAIVIGIANSYLGSPERLARVALEEAEQAESAGHTDEALTAYQRVLDDHPSGGTETARAAALGLVRVLAARVQAPLTPERVDEVMRIVRRYQELPAHARGGEAASLLVRRIEEWADQIRGEGASGRRASLRLTDVGREVAQGSDRQRLDARAAALHTELAREVREDWPLEALHHYVLAGTPEAMGEATGIVASLDASLLADAEADVEAWRGAVTDAPDAVEHVAELRRQLAELRDDVRRTQALEASDAEALAVLHDERPADQTVAAALADARRASGDVEGALALLAPYGAPGRLDARAQRALAGCYAEQGRLDEADALLTRQVELHLADFQEAQRAYDAASEERSQTLLANARAGLEPALDARLTGVEDEDRARTIFSEWLRERLDADPEIARLREEYLRHAGVVPTVLTLGTLKLRRAHEARGEERAQLLTEAERLFLSIRQEAEGVPAFHMSLGQVYHRLGRTEDGERELRALLDRADPVTSLSVAHVYRELGLVRRAREIAEGVYHQTESATGEMAAIRGNAAVMLSVLAMQPEDEELWLTRAPQDDPEVRIRLVAARAERAMREGNLREADRLLAEVVQHYEEQGEGDAAAANNGALAHQRRYQCTGDAAELERALTQLEQSLRLTPDNAIVLGNVAEMTLHRGEVRVLDHWVRAHVLRLSPAYAEALVSALREGSVAAELATALREDASLRRSRELTRQEQVLAPQSTRPWMRAWQWAASENDEAEVAALLSRVRAVEGLDTSSYEEARERAEDPEQEARSRAELDAAVTDAERVLEAAERTRHAPTTAAARFVLGNLLVARSLDRASIDDARRGVTLAREARAAWDGIGSSQLSVALTAVVLLETMEQSPALRAVFDERGRDLPAALALREAVGRDPSLSATLRARPELTEAAQLRADTPASELGLEDIALAELADHAGLRTAAAACRTRPVIRDSLELRALLFPSDPVVSARRSLLDG